MNPTPPMTPIRIVLADDELLLREAIMTLLALEPDIDIVGTADNGAEAVDLVRRARPDVAVLDLEMPEKDGVEAAAAIRAVVPDTRVILLTRHARPAVLRRALDSGVSAFVTKATSVKELPSILRQVAQGGRYVDGAVATAALSESNCPLTDRELDVLRESLDGATIRVIAERTHLAPGTVRNYISTAMTKLGADTRVQAARIAWNEGWV
ncbi:Transcriptional regulatory protein DegU [Micromonospora sp. MW-13]|uniref:response regulator transcription factor n=1 Tax=unclassified Micromonospora TaxID=2617518 RepID=UPI000EEF283E|nr:MULTISPECIES: response regulator transcription factor [unclassified Micromonospora]MCX4471450.1 response regulator transcription factor [Micromonospora sp. NBC_01655]RGC64982.1 Transcriptional regulatory protein DegU [Micromonospora sp. MW-13]